MASASPRRSMRLAVKNFTLAYAKSERFYEAARALWERGLPLSPDVLELQRISEKAEDALTPAAKILLGAWLYDQPLPGDLDERRFGGEDFSVEEILSEIEALRSQPVYAEQVEREDNRRFLEQVSALITT